MGVIWHMHAVRCSDLALKRLICSLVSFLLAVIVRAQVRFSIIARACCVLVVDLPLTVVGLTIYKLLVDNRS